MFEVDQSRIDDGRLKKLTRQNLKVGQEIKLDDGTKIRFDGVGQWVSLQVSHDPTQGFRQGNDMGTQYRSAIYTHTDAQRAAAEASRAMYQAELTKAGYGTITTEIADAPEFFFAEDYHQQYLAKNPNGYCPVHATGVRFSGPIQEMQQV